MCVHDLDHDLKYSVFKVIVYVKYEFKFFLVFKFLTGRWSVGRWSVHLIGGRLVGWSVVLRKPNYHCIISGINKSEAIKLM